MVLTLICVVCGTLLSSLRLVTRTRIEEQILKNVQAPAVKKILAASANDPIADRRTITLVDGNVMVFPGINNGRVEAFAYETEASGYGGDLGVVVGYDVATDKILGIGVSKCSETPGLGTRVKEEGFCRAFAGLAVMDRLRLKKDGGSIDGVTGATISSRAVCAALNESMSRYQDVKAQILSEKDGVVVPK